MTSFIQFLRSGRAGRFIPELDCIYIRILSVNCGQPGTSPPALAAAPASPNLRLRSPLSLRITMRFTPQFLDELRARLPVSEVVGKRVKLRKAGREWKGLSPFNQEKTPSFFVNDQKG